MTTIVKNYIEKKHELSFTSIFCTDDINKIMSLVYTKDNNNDNDNRTCNFDYIFIGNISNDKKDDICNFCSKYINDFEQKFHYIQQMILSKTIDYIVIDIVNAKIYYYNINFNNFQFNSVTNTYGSKFKLFTPEVWRYAESI